MNKFISIIIGLYSLMGVLAQESRIDLSGLWRFQLDPMGFGKTPGSELYLNKLTGSIVLPGSTDKGGKGIRNEAIHVDRLSRKFEYCGQAWYQREVNIPESWLGKEITLTLERCHWETSVYVDGILAGVDERLSTPNRFVLTKQLTPGIHTITLCVDNRSKYPMGQWAHGTTEYTQTNWNGIIGTICLEAKPNNFLKQVKITPNIHDNSIRIRCSFHPSGKECKGVISFTVKDSHGHNIAEASSTTQLTGKGDTLVQNLKIDGKIDLWDEFSPVLYTLMTTWKTDSDKETHTERFGMREVEQGKHHILLNGHHIHLCGVLDCAVFPLNGYPATDTASWKRIMATVKDYGFNHIRFHSWCPPKAAFAAADELGLYLQAELPMWIKDVGKSPARRNFFEEEMYALLDEYGNHPSFVLYCNGNENEGDFAVLEDLIRKGKIYDDRHLYSASTARTHVDEDEYYTSHVTDKGWITVYEGKPGTDWDRNEASDINVPVIAHETGQRCMYPNFKEISKYTGVLEARNFKVFLERLAKNGMLHQAEEFFRSTGAHTVLQYKEVNESLLRTDKSGGFQLLGLADFPGQGSAFVGILDAFWESKGLISPEKFRESCAPVVLLARFPKRIYTEKETFTPVMELYQFGPNIIKSGKMEWMLTDETGYVIERGKLSHHPISPGQVDSLGKINVPLSSISKAGKHTFKAKIGDLICNKWDIWVYPSRQEARSIVLVQDWKEAKERLQKGDRVCFVPDSIMGRKTRFASHFWNPIMFNWDPMIVGTCIHDQHPLFQNFPTSYYADWQWWDILNNAGAIDLTELDDLTPIIQSIDTYEENRKLGIAFEARVGKGKLLFLNVDIGHKMDDRPATRQLLQSVSEYLVSEDFNPDTELQPYQLDALFSTSTGKQKDATGNAAIKQLLNQ